MISYIKNFNCLFQKEYDGRIWGECICVELIAINKEWTKGPGTQASISPVSDHWKNWQSIKVLYFLRAVWSVEISTLEPKKMWCFFGNVFWCNLSTGNISTNMIYTTKHIWLLLWKRQLRQGNVKSVETISRQNIITKRVQKKALSFFGSYSEISTNKQTSFIKS